MQPQAGQEAAEAARAQHPEEQPQMGQEAAEAGRQRAVEPEAGRQRAVEPGEGLTEGGEQLRQIRSSLRARLNAPLRPRSQRRS